MKNRIAGAFDRWARVSPVGPVPVIGSPLRLSDSPARYDPIPALGQDTEAILRELGYGAAEMEQLG